MSRVLGCVCVCAALNLIGFNVPAVLTGEPETIADIPILPSWKPEAIWDAN